MCKTNFKNDCSRNLFFFSGVIASVTNCSCSCFMFKSIFALETNALQVNQLVCNRRAEMSRFENGVLGNSSFGGRGLTLTDVHR